MTTLAMLKFAQGGFDPNQPRAPAGTSEGGRWVKTGSANQYRDGKTKVTGTGPHGRVTVEDIAKFFDEDAILMDMTDPDTAAHAERILRQELEYQLTQGHTGKHWYNENVNEAFDITSTLIPELKDPINRRLFSVVAGIQSIQTPVNKNWEQAAVSFEYFAKNGEFPVKNPESGKNWGLTVKSDAIETFNAMLKDKGVGGTLEYLFGMHTVKELNEAKSRYGGYKSNSVGGKMGDMRIGLDMFGEKVGPFIKNLNDIDDVTVDLWTNRTVRRYTGNLSGPDADKPSEPERRFTKALYRKVAPDFGMKEQDVQAVMWVYEQKLYSSLGMPNTDAKTFADGARKWVSSREQR